MEQVCKHFQCGYCKFGDKCRKHHVKEICPTQGCLNKSCTKRHPKLCKFFRVQQSCKFADQCSYRHDKSINKNDTCELIDKITFLEGAMKIMKENINDLKEEVDSLKKNTHMEPQGESFKCDHCDYTGSTKTVVKRHMTQKHKTFNHPCEECNFKATSSSELEHHIFTSHQKETPIKEIERCESFEDSLVLSVEKEERLEACSNFSPSPPHKLSTVDSLPSSPGSPSILFEKCAFVKCFNNASKFFHTTMINKTRYHDVLICSACTRFIPLKEIKANPPEPFP